MNKKLYIISAMIAGSVIGLSFYGCKKTEVDSDTQTAEDNAQSEFVYSDCTNIVDDGARNETGINKGIMPYYASPAGCYSVYTNFVTNNTAPYDTTERKMTCSWGTSNCLCLDNRWRRGQIVATISGGKHYSEVGAVVTITFVGYYVNNHHIEGTITLTHNAANTYTISIQNGKITRPDGKYHSRTGSITRTCIANCSAVAATARSYSLTGSGSGTNINGETYSLSITNPVIVDPACKYIAKGTIEVTPGNKPTRVLDFGDGTCDDKATVTINGNTFNISLQ